MLSLSAFFGFRNVGSSLGRLEHRSYYTHCFLRPFVLYITSRLWSMRHLAFQLYSSYSVVPEWFIKNKQLQRMCVFFSFKENKKKKLKHFYNMHVVLHSFGIFFLMYVFLNDTKTTKYRKKKLLYRVCIVVNG